MKYIVALSVLWLFCKSAYSQSSASGQNGLYKTALRFNVTGLMDPLDNNISVGGEFVFHPNWSVITDIAYIEYSCYFSRPESTSGYIIKPAIRYYPKKSHKEFFEANLFYKHVNYHLKDWLNKDCVNGVPAYQQYQNFVFAKRVTGLNLLVGFQTDLSKNKALRFEGYSGLGIRIKQQNPAGEENTCYNINRSFINIRGRNGTSVSTGLPLGFRLIYCIK